MQDGKLRGTAAARPSARQCASALLMVRPRHFGFNAQTAVTNRFQRPAGVDVAERARREFDAFVAASRQPVASP